MWRPSVRRLSAMVLGTSLVLTGCASIPTSGAVNSGIQLDDSSAVELDILARGPQPGDSQEQILDGFLAAAASPQLDYRIAREFLTPEFSKAWKPDAGTTIDRIVDRAAQPTGRSSMALRIRPTASVSDDGVYTAASTGAAETRNFSLQQVDGEWRIASAPQGIILDETSFGIVFGSYTLQFLSPDGRFFVPDVRWFARRETTQTAIVRALVAGPVPWLAPGVQSAIPVGARLDSDSVPVVGSTATVSLAVDTPPSISELTRMQSQLRLSLAGVTGVTAVALVVNGTVENLPPSGSTATLSPAVDARPAVLTADGFGFLSSASGQIEVERTLSRALVAANPSAIALGSGGGFAAIRSARGIERVTSSGSQVLRAGESWLAPSVDPQGGVWVADSATELDWLGPNGAELRLPTSWGSAPIRGIAVSRDGARVAALLQAGQTVRVVVCAIGRAADGRPTGLGAPQLIAAVPGLGDTVAWADPTTVAVLGTSGASGRALSFIQVGGQVSSLTAPATAVSIAFGNSSRDVRVLDSAGQLLQPSGSTWQVRSAGVRVLATQTGLG